MLFRKIAGVLRAFARAVRRTHLEERLDQRFQALRATFRRADPKAPLIAVGAPADSVYYAILGEILCAIRQRHSARVHQLQTKSHQPGAAQSLLKSLPSYAAFNAFTRRKWESLYGAFCDRVGYRLTGWSAPHRFLSRRRHAMHRWRTLQSKEMLAELEYCGVLIGDLIIDSYLRLKPAVSIDLRDRYLLTMIRQALKDVEIALAYFRSARPVALLMYYSSYLEHGIPVRAALACGIKTVTFGNLQEFSTLTSLERPHHTKPSAHYARDFARLSGQPARLESAARALELRLSGGIDPATAYMKTSAYSVITQAIPYVSGAAVIFLHDFYDSLHVYSWTLFHDFWEWAEFTIESLQAAGQPFWIKPHPNQGAESSAEIARLRRKYPGIRMLPSVITNRQLAEAGMACAITMYGSVAPEMAFMGVPSISSGDSPHASFDAFYLARTRAEYQDLLSNIPQLPVDVTYLKTQACAFYHMHNQNLDAADLEARYRFVDTWVHLNALETKGCFDENKTGSVLAGLTENPGFARFCETLFPSNHTQD